MYKALLITTILSAAALPGHAYPGRYSAEQAKQLCRDEVRERAARDIARDIEFLNTDIDPNAADHNRVIGRFDAPEAGERYQFSCSMRADGSLRSVNIEPLRPTK